MGPKVLFIHASNQMRTVWLISGSRFSSPYDIQAKNPALKLSFLALIISYLVMGLYDYLYYPVDVFGGYVDDGISRLEYTGANQISHWVGIALGYLMLFLLAIPLGYSKRFWQGLIALNWWSVIVTPVFFPLILIQLIIDENDPFFFLVVLILLLAIVVIVWKSINLTKNSLKIEIWKTVLLTVFGVGIQILASYSVLDAMGIRIF